MANPITDGMDEAAETRHYRKRQFEKAELAHEEPYPYALKISGMNNINITNDEFDIIRAILTR